MIKNIIFDISGIFITCDEDLILKHYSDKYNIPFKRAKQAYGNHFENYERGEFSKDEFTKRVFGDMSLEWDPHFWEVRIKLKKRYDEMFEFLEKIKEKYSVYFVSNEGREYWKMVDEKLDITRHFIDGVVSFQAGVRKPDLKIFKMLLERNNLKPEECIFIDDSEKNLDGARQLGMEVLHYTGVKKLEGDLRKLGITY